YLVYLLPIMSKNMQGVLLEQVCHLPELCIREALYKCPECFFLVIRKTHMAYAFGRGSNQDVTEPAFGKTVVYGKFFAPVLVFAGSHSFNFYKKVMQPSRSGKSRIISCVEQRAVLVPENLFGVLYAQVL